MALRTLGTNANNSLTALVYDKAFSAIDFGNLKNAVKKNNPLAVPLNESFALEHSGMLHMPGNRGFLQVQVGDAIAVDPVSGWPIVISKNALTIGAFTLT